MVLKDLKRKKTLQRKVSFLSSPMTGLIKHKEEENEKDKVHYY
jgi:hypothetical protein